MCRQWKFVVKHLLEAVTTHSAPGGVWAAKCAFANKY